MKWPQWIAALITVSALVGCAKESAQQTIAPENQTAAVTYPLTRTDDAGHTVTLTKKPQRIASATEGTDEILTALVPKSDIVLVTQYASNPTYSNVSSLVRGIPTIQTTNAEQVIAAKPDLVLLASYTEPAIVQQIQQAHIPAYEFNDFQSIADIERNIRVIGQLVDNPQGADKLVTNMNRELQTIATKVSGQPKLRVLDYSSFGYAAGSDTTVNDVIVHAGGINAAKDLHGWQKITDEQVVKLNPDVIIDTTDDQAFVQKLLSNPALQHVSAIAHHRVYTVNSADLTSVSQYVTRGLRMWRKCCTLR
ncbi:putative ABC transporter substrate-binding lipoprotein YvrC [Alicyclobacillus contaminans]|nr:putative ABC transporter substrate-binding lipoprotein YvrC [Alicyclobacillus contaminans]